MSPGKRGLVGLLTSVFVSTLGTRMTSLALPWFVLVTTGSATSTGLIAAAQMTPYVLVQGLGGPVVDRCGAWRVSVGTDVVAAIALGTVPLLHMLGGLGLGLLAVLVAIAGAARGAGDAARDVLLPAVGEDAASPLERSAGLYDGASRTAGLIGAPIAGVLITVTPAVNVLALDAASFAASAALVLTLVPRSAQPQAPDGPPLSYRHSLAEGFAHLRADRLLLGIGVMVLVTNLLDQAGSAVLTPVWAREVAHSSVALGLISGAFGVGTVVGNVTAAWLGPRLPRRMTYAVGFLITGGPRYLTLALASSVSPVLVICTIAGLGAGGINPILGAVQYERIPRHLQVRVLGAINALAWGGIPLGSLLGGASVAGVGLRTALAVTAATYFVTTLTPFVFPAWRQMERAPAPDRDRLPVCSTGPSR